MSPSTSRPTPSRPPWALLASVAVAGLAAAGLAQRQRSLALRRAANRDIRVAVVGAGVVGTTYAVHLAREGMDVSLLARGERASQLIDRGVAVRDLYIRRRHAAPLCVTASLPQDVPWDLVIVAVDAGEALEAAPTVRALDHVGPVLWLHDTPMGVDVLTAGVDEPAAVVGVPATGGARANDEVYSLPLWTGATVIGETDGGCTPRLRQAAAVLRRAGLKVEIQRRILPWLETHAAMLVVLAGAVTRNGGVRALARDAAETEFYFATLREAMAVLEASGIPITPASQKEALYRPRWSQRLSMRLSSLPYWVGTVVDEHVASASAEIGIAYERLVAFAEEAGVETPLLTSLAPYLRNG